MKNINKNKIESAILGGLLANIFAPGLFTTIVGAFVGSLISHEKTRKDKQTNN